MVCCVYVGASEPACLFQIQLASESPDNEKLRVVETAPHPGREVHYFFWPDERTGESILEIAWDLLDEPNRCQGISISAEVESALEVV